MYRYVGLILLCVGAVSVILWWNNRPVAVSRAGQPTLPMKTLTIGNTTLQVEVASTLQENQVGLSGRVGLAPMTGMLFIFAEPNTHGFWMKDMRFSLDIIWADTQGKVVTILPNISPDTFPQAFHPSEPSLYVLEVPAGFAGVYRVAIGDKIVVQ